MVHRTRCLILIFSQKPCGRHNEIKLQYLALDILMIKYDTCALFLAA